MDGMKNLCALIPEPLHAKVCEERERSNQTLSQYITELLTNYYENGGKNQMENTRTMAFQISEELFQRLKDFLDREKERTGKKLSQKEFIIGLVEKALDETDTYDAQKI
ncbi:4-oxalocrotonate tautomerase [uncultured Oscillibacter sp.]|uniref:4-oxalocrotonate tautomerase n=1 Tax=uncultured Oscillibacter sp. TaxID=876091 RepID=UPI0025CDD7B1|nr:4-oxalocrotonate tautomerase [uncultured Oscillibacter sp.]